MTTGEKIKYFRNMRGISQETLGQLSGINSATIKKYEYGIRNPKPDQLLKIANALGISINIFMDFDIETVSDVLSLLFKLGVCAWSGGACVRIADIGRRKRLSQCVHSRYRFGKSEHI